MDEVSNLTKEEVLKVIKKFPIQPLKNRLIITVNVDEPDGDLILSNNSFSEKQYVMAIGSFIKDYVPGDAVLLDLEKMMEYTSSDTNSYEKISRIKIDPIEVNGRMYAIINDSVVKAIDNR